MVSKHTKPNAKIHKVVLLKEASIHISNLNPTIGDKPTRVGRKQVDGKLVRYAKNREEIK